MRCAHTRGVIELKIANALETREGGGEGRERVIAEELPLLTYSGMRKKFDRLRIGLLFHSREYYEDYLRDKGEEGEIYLRRCELKFPRECKE